jgi:predicted Zn-dependent protease with MMP-like domain
VTDPLTDDDAFDAWIDEAIGLLPEAFRDRLGSVALVVEEWPTVEQLASTGAPGLYGLYQGVPRSVLGADHAMTPSLITIFRGTIRANFRTPAAQRAQVIDTVHHEIAHHFGISDQRLRELGAGHHSH